MSLIIFCFVIGVFMGLFFYSGLFWTIKKGLTSKHAGVIFVASFFIRIGATLAVFALLSGGEVTRILACTVGFAISRLAFFYFDRIKIGDWILFEKGGRL